MTYCVAMLLDTGMVFLSDSRTSAGVDQINTFRKTTVFQRPGDRVMVLQTAGNLAITQAVTSVLREHIEAGDGRPSLFSAANLFDAARCVGDAIREVHKRDAEQLKEFGLDFNASVRSRTRGELMKVLRCIDPKRAKTAFSRPGIIWMTRFCSGTFIFVWKPTMLK